MQSGRLRRPASRTKLLGALAAGALALAACGNDSDDGAETAEPTDEEEAAETTETTEEAAPDEPEDPAGDAIVQTGDTDLGPVLTNADGFTLYGFEPDEGGIPTCEDTCADQWPPLIVDGASVPEGLDTNIFSVAQRSDGSYQLLAGDWPLYTYFDDNAPGDTNGQPIPAWWVVTPEGELNMAGAES